MEEVKVPPHHMTDERQIYGHPDHVPMPGHPDQMGPLNTTHHMQSLRPAHHHGLMNHNMGGPLHHPGMDIRPNNGHVNGPQQPNDIGQAMGRLHGWQMNQGHAHPMTQANSTGMMPDQRTQAYPGLRDTHPTSLYAPTFQSMPSHSMSHTLHLGLNPNHHFIHEENNTNVWQHQMFGETNNTNIPTSEHRTSTNNAVEQHPNEKTQESPEVQENPKPMESADIEARSEIVEPQPIVAKNPSTIENQEITTNDVPLQNVKVETKINEINENDKEEESINEQEKTENTDKPEDLCKDNLPNKEEQTEESNEPKESEENIVVTDFLSMESATQSTKEFVCPECGKECANKGVLGRHLKYSHGEKKYQCEECDFKATRKDTFAKHMKLNHESQERKKGPHLSELDRGRVIALKEVGWTYPSIASHVGCSATTCKNVWRKFVRDGSHKKAKRRSSHRCTNPMQDAQILQLATMDPNRSAVDIVKELNLNICAKTVRRRLNKLGLYSRMLTVQDHLSLNQMRLRYEFACLYRDDRIYTQDFWKRVVFADEKTFDIDKNGKVKIWHPKCQSLNPNDNKQKNAGRFGPGLNFYGCYNAQGFCQLHELPTKFGSDDYKNLLRDIIIPSLRMKYPIPQQIYYVQDKSPVHTSSNVAAFFRSMDHVTVINLPPKGSDMNPIEDVWNRMLRRIKASQTWTVEEFRAGIYSAWHWCRQHENYFDQLSGSMCDRVASVVASEGGWAKY